MILGQTEYLRSIQKEISSEGLFPSSPPYSMPLLSYPHRFTSSKLEKHVFV